MATQTGQLIIQYEGAEIQVLPLNMPVLSIGRAPGNGLSLSHPSISRHHAELRMEPQGPLLTDLSSANGTFVGSQRLLPNQPRVLTDGTTFRIGPYLLTYRASKQTQQPLQKDEEHKPVQASVAAIPEPVIVSSPAPSLVPRSVEPDLTSTTYELDGTFLRYLPDIYQENDFLKRFLHIFEYIWEPLEQRQDHIAMYFDPRTCPVTFLPWLASWLELPFNVHWPEARHRHLLAQAMQFYNWRGSHFGLKRMIEVCTGLTPEIVESPSQPYVFQIRITLPPGSSSEMMDRELIEELIQLHKPAYAGYVLEVSI
jgi:phage tail-like protein